jgi:hypothetical protein
MSFSRPHPDIFIPEDFALLVEMFYLLPSREKFTNLKKDLIGICEEASKQMNL